jgi:hypothetical protein
MDVWYVFVLSFVYVEALRRADHSSKSPTDCKMIKIKKKKLDTLKVYEERIK